jgi:CDP-diacylglycerol--glycerol-3-phosphate 3-phosphatidyltransferase
MIPLFILVFFLDCIPYNYVISAVIFALAAFTDFIDGHIARSRGLVTNLGKFLDPIADKVLVSTAMMLVLTLPGLFWLNSTENALYIIYAVCVCVIMARELIISAFRQIAATRGLVLAAEKLGKYKTACQDVSIVVFLVAADCTGNFGNFVFGLACGLFAAATVLTVWSGISYVVKNKQVLKDN